MIAFCGLNDYKGTSGKKKVFPKAKGSGRASLPDPAVPPPLDGSPRPGASFAE